MAHSNYPFSLSFLFWNETELQYTIACLAFFILLEAKLNFSSDKIILLEKQNGWHKTFAKDSEFEKKRKLFSVLLFSSTVWSCNVKKLDNLKLLKYFRLFYFIQFCLSSSSDKPKTIKFWPIFKDFLLHSINISADLRTLNWFCNLLNYLFLWMLIICFRLQQSQLALLNLSQLC